MEAKSVVIFDEIPLDEGLLEPPNNKQANTEVTKGSKKPLAP